MTIRGAPESGVDAASLLIRGILNCAKASHRK
jgi:hypothetical protein